MLRVGVVADPEGLAARTPWGRVRRLRWRDVHHFEVRGHWRDLGACTVDGRWVPLLRYSNFERRSVVELARLEDYRWACQYHLGLVWTSAETGGPER